MTWWQYLMLVNVYLLLFYGFYILLLSKETFFQLNRIYLVSAVLLSFFIPMIQADWVKNLFITQKVQYTFYSSPVLNYRFIAARETHFTVGQVFTVVYLAGIAFLLVRFVLQLIALKRVIDSPAPSAAYSFFKKIKLGNQHLHNDVIEAHENVHAMQWHSADVLIMEALIIINWFNPIVYLYRFAIKHIHEFIADRQAVKAGTGKADYALILLSQTFNTPTHHLVNPFFNKSLLKQRILMLQKNRSQRVALFKYFLSAPLFMLMLILSSATVNNSKAIRVINNKVADVFLLSPGQKLVTQSATPAPANKDYIKEAYAATQVTSGVQTVTIDAAEDTGKKKSGIVFTSVEHVPEFPGGLPAFGEFLSKNISYPEAARMNNVQGRVIISFIVETDGSLSNLRVVRSLGSGTDEEAIRVLALSPKWIPGLQNGRKVRVAYSVPINYTLNDDGDKKVPANKTGGIDESTPENKTITLNQTTQPDTSKSTSAYFVNRLYLSSHPPLYVIDGVQTDNLDSVNPNDIQSISVIKEKSTTSIYGEKGKNGVIIVTTKKNLLKLKPVDVSKN